jgi:hypothetical protein
MTMSQAPRNTVARAGSVLGLTALIFAVVVILLMLTGGLVHALNFLLWFGILLAWIPFALSVLGIVFAAIGLSRAPVAGDRQIAVRALVPSIVAIVLPVVGLAVGRL